jgi:spore maturation protein CgeB
MTLQDVSKRLKLMILSTDYPEFLSWLYSQHPRLEREPYEHQARVRRESLFGTADFYSSNLRKLGYEVWDIHVNNEFMQKAWANEYGPRVDSGPRWQFGLKGGVIPWMSRASNRLWDCQILMAQIKHYKPDVLLNQAMSGVSNDFLREIKPYVKLLVGEHAATALSETENWSVYDLVISSFPPTVDWFRSKGVPAELSHRGFEPGVLSHLKDGEKRIPISFVGSFNPTHHNARVEWLEYLCSRLPVKIWSPHTNYLLGILDASPIFRSSVGAAWGVEMYQVLRDSFLTLSHHGDLPPYANNRRLFEATGVGTLLITDWKKNLHEMFEPGKEIVTYRDPEECAELIRYYLEHEKERSEIARAGQRRTLREHTYYQRMQELVEIVEKRLFSQRNKTMVLKEVSRRVLPPVALEAGRWLLKGRSPTSAARTTFQYGQFTLECDSSHHLPEVLRDLPNFGRNLADVVGALDAEEPHVIDVGANIGDTAILLARFAPGAKVLCIEGDLGFMSDLRSNTSQISGVTIAEAILSDRSGQVAGEFVTVNGTAHVALGEGNDSLQVRTLDDLLTAYPEFSHPDVLKIDTDGFEPAILRGAKSVLASSQPVVFYEWHPDFYHQAGENNTGHADLLMELGYEGFLIFTNRGELLLRVRRPTHDILESLAAFSHARRRIDNWHFDIAAFPTKRLDVWGRFSCHYAKLSMILIGCLRLLDGLTFPLATLVQ